MAVAVLVALLAPACGDDDPDATWAQVTAPSVVDQTDDVVVVDGTLADGTYWGTVARVSGTGEVVFRVVKARFGTFCEAWAAERGRATGCLNDYDVETYPDAHAALADDAAVTVAVPDAPGTNLVITPSRLGSLLTGEVGEGPTGYAWVPFPFVVRVDGGYVVDAQQFWVP